jgi:hypothetical protein
MTHVVACMKITKHDPKVKSRLDWCAKCKFPIAVALSTPQFDDAVYMCMTCVPWEEVEEITPLSLEQIADMRQVLKRENENGNGDRGN